MCMYEREREIRQLRTLLFLSLSLNDKNVYTCMCVCVLCAWYLCNHTLTLAFEKKEI